MHSLRFVLPNDLLHSLQFHQQTITNNQIRSKYPNNNSTKANWDRNLGLYGQTSLSQRKSHSLPINRFKKPIPQLVINIIKNTNHPLSQFNMLTCHSSLIRVIRAHPC